MQQAIYKIIQDTFDHQGNTYNLAITPQLYAEEDGLDVAGGFIGLLIHPKYGTLTFEIQKEEELWMIDPNHRDEIDEAEEIGDSADVPARFTLIDPDEAQKIGTIVEKHFSEYIL